MRAVQIELPLYPLQTITTKQIQPDNELIGKQFSEGKAIITVTNLCSRQPGHVVVLRDLDGRSWSVPAWMIRRILGKKRSRAA
jgi:hypothetical protein